MANAATIGIIGILLLAGAGTIYTITKEQQPFTYVCTKNNLTAIFNNLSSTNKTGYWTDVNGTKKSAVCTNGYWITIDDWCIRNNVDCKIFLADKDGMIINDTMYDEFGNEIIQNNTIKVSDNATININGVLYTVEYIEKPPKEVIKETIKCICGKETCLITDCLK